MRLRGDSITAVRFSSATAAVIDLCFDLVHVDPEKGWRPVPGFIYPMPLPVAHGDYPCPGKPASELAAEAVGLGRVTYGPPARWGGAAFAELHDLMESLVVGGPAGLPMEQRASAQVESDGSPVQMPSQRPLHLLLLGTLSPAVAQLVGLYFVDRDVTAGQVYDYLIVADRNGVLGGSATSALAWIATHATFPGVDASMGGRRRGAPSRRGAPASSRSWLTAASLPLALGVPQCFAPGADGRM